MKTLRMVRQWTVLMLYSIILVFYWKKGKRSCRYGQQGEWRPGKRRRDWMWGTVVRKGSVRGSRCFGITEQSWGPRAYRGWSVQTQELPRRRERLLRTPRRQGPHWAKLFASVHLCFVPNLGNFQPLFLQKFFSAPFVFPPHVEP